MNDIPILANYINQIDKDNKIYINVGASYEFNLSREIAQQSDLTLFFEYNTSKTYNYENMGPNFRLETERVTPNNIVDLISKHTDQKKIKLFDIDIDGYDWFVTQKVLENFRPTIILAEINEKIPPPIKFTAKYLDDYSWDTSHFYGCSLEKYAELFEKHRYKMVHLSYNNVYAVAEEHAGEMESYSTVKLFDKFYRNTDKDSYFGHNRDVNCWLDMAPEKAIESISSYFKNREGQFEIGL